MNYEDLFKGRSMPRNPIIANIFYRLKYIETFGTGISKIFNGYDKYDLKPKFDIMSSAVRIILPNLNYSKNLKNDTENDTENDTKNDTNDTKNDTNNITNDTNNRLKTILNEINKNPSISAQKLSLILNVKPITVKRDLTYLKENDIIKRIGSSRNGHWKIN